MDWRHHIFQFHNNVMKNITICYKWNMSITKPENRRSTQSRSMALARARTTLGLPSRGDMCPRFRDYYYVIQRYSSDRFDTDDYYLIQRFTIVLIKDITIWSKDFTILWSLSPKKMWGDSLSPRPYELICTSNPSVPGQHGQGDPREIAPFLQPWRRWDQLARHVQGGVAQRGV